MNKSLKNHEVRGKNDNDEKFEKIDNDKKNELITIT